MPEDEMLRLQAKISRIPNTLLYNVMNDISDYWKDKSNKVTFHIPSSPSHAFTREIMARATTRKDYAIHGEIEDTVYFGNDSMCTVNNQPVFWAYNLVTQTVFYAGIQEDVIFQHLYKALQDSKRVVASGVWALDN